MPPVPTVGRPGGASAGHGTSVTRDKQRASGRPDDRRNEAVRDLVCTVKYSNTLPDIPFDPKFMTCNDIFGNTRFIDYKPTSLERNYKYEILTEHDLGVAVDLILPDAYLQQNIIDDLSYGDHLDPKDEKLLEDELHSAQNTKRSQRHATSLSWMRKPDYISTEQTRYQPTTIEKIESKIGLGVRKKLGTSAPSVYMDKEAQILAIEKTFEDSKIPIERHYNPEEKGIYPVEVLPLLPDSDMWKFPCAQVIFDADPAPQGPSMKDQIEMMSQAMIRGVMDESGEQFVAYFLPTDETREKRKKDQEEDREYEEDMEYEYKMSREYNWNVKSKTSKGYEENYFFIKRDDGVYYDELETRVRLSKRRLRAGQQPSNSKLVVRHRPLNKTEHKMQRYRERHLEPPGEEEEMSEDDEEEEENLPQTGDNEDGENRSRSNSRSKSRSRSRSRSKSRSRSRTKSRSRSGSDRSKSRSRSRSQSRSVSRSRTPSKSPQRSKSVSRSRSNSPSNRSASGSRSRSRSEENLHPLAAKNFSWWKPNSRSPGSARGSRSRSRSSSPGSGSGRSRSASPAQSGSGSD